MLICADCRREMRCYKNELGVRYGQAHVYHGDAFACDGCDRGVIVTAGTPVHDPDGTVNTLQMPETKETHVE